ncbi:MAG: DUF4290 domain-containing protein [Sediminibacterium sp.]|nr:DUF4290 domain-containing protein [Sediminibacterium sp.]
MEYNSSRGNLQIKEYGRHVQKMVEGLRNIADLNKRQEQAECIIELMEQLNPAIKIAQDYRQKLWDHLFIISGFNLDVKSPYPIPNKEDVYRKPQPLPYPKKQIKYRHLGHNLEQFINIAIEEQNIDKRNYYGYLIAYYMKLAYSNYHKELVHDDTIRAELNSISGGKIEFSHTPFVRHIRVVEERTDFRANKWNNRFKTNRNSGNYYKGRYDNKKPKTW